MRRAITSASETKKKRDERLRAEGWDDGFHGRPAAKVDAMYQTSWRRGRERRRSLDAGEVEG